MYDRLELGSDFRHGAADDLLTADEVADLLRMTSAWVYAQTRRNRIPHMRLGRYFRYRRSAIEAWICQIETEPGSTRPPKSTTRT